MLYYRGSVIRSDPFPTNNKAPNANSTHRGLGITWPPPPYTWTLLQAMQHPLRVLVNHFTALHHDLNSFANSEIGIALQIEHVSQHSKPGN
jgi:hypothetical protein